MALSAAERRRRNNQIQRAQEAIARGETITAQNIVNNLVGGGSVGGAQAALQNAINNIQPTVTPAQIVPINPGSGNTDTGNTDTGGGNTQSPGDRSMQTYYDNLNAQLQEERRQAREGAKAYLGNILSQFGLGSLSGNIERLIGEWGTNTEVIAERLRQTDQYKTRFKGMLQLQQRGIPDIRNEAEYISLESEYRRVFRENNLTSFLGDAGTQNEYDKIADLVGKFSLSVNEVRDRISDAQRVVAQTPQEVRNAFREYYNIESNSLVSYVLDPERASVEINRMANAAIVGGMAQQTNLNLGRGVSERIAGMRGGDQDLNADAIAPELTSIASTRNATSRLADLEKSVLSDDEVALAEMDLDAAAKQKVRGLQSRERARFSGSSAINSGTLSRRGGV